jgi:hypothetical protein
LAGIDTDGRRCETNIGATRAILGVVVTSVGEDDKLAEILKESDISVER